jgi:ribosomal protein S18 acetylase RimI-like enzyme
MIRPLDNIAWNALAGPQAGHAVGGGTARRYAPGFAALAGFQDPARPDFQDLAGHCEPGELVYLPGWTGELPQGWQLHEEAPLFRMVWTGDVPAAHERLDAVRLDAREHADQALALVERTRPGPFGRRTLELGEYLGFFERGELVAMAGERLFAPPYREISGVCTHPDHRGRGLARRLMLRLVRHQMQRRETPCLHVAQANVAAHGLYEHMGFRTVQSLTVRVVSRR